MNNKPVAPISFEQMVVRSVLALSFVSILYFFFKNQPDFFQQIATGRTDYVSTLIWLLILHTIISVVVIKMLIRNNKRKLADADLLDLNGLIREDRKEPEPAFGIRRKLLHFLGYQKGAFYTDKSGLRISKHVRLLTKKVHEHVFILGPTGSGKSASVFIPAILDYDNGSFLCMDPKGEICEKTRTTLLKKGFKIMRLNFTDTTDTVHFSLLGNCDNHDDIRKLSANILIQKEDDEWGKMSQNLLNAFMIHEFDTNFEHRSIINVFENISLVSQDEFKEFFLNSSNEAFTEYQQFEKTATSEKTIGSIYTTILERLQVFRFENVQKIDSYTSFSPLELRREKIALFLTYPERDAKYYSSYISPFYVQFFNKILEDETKTKDSKSIVFLLDEFCNTGRIDNLQNYLNTIRSKRCGIVMGIQNTQQLKDVYGEKAGPVIFESAKTIVAFSGMKGETANLMASLTGEEMYDSKSISRSSSDVSISESSNKKNVLSADQIRRLDKMEMLCIFDNFKPFVDLKNFYYLDDIETYVMHFFNKRKFPHWLKKKLLKMITSLYKKEETIEVVDDEKDIELNEIETEQDEREIAYNRRLEEKKKEQEERIRLMKEKAMQELEEEKENKELEKILQEEELRKKKEKAERIAAKQLSVEKEEFETLLSGSLFDKKEDTQENKETFKITDFSNEQPNDVDDTKIKTIKDDLIKRFNLDDDEF